MKVAYSTPPGRFPTVVHDPGAWWQAAGSLDSGIDLVALPLGTQWWRAVCESAPAASAALAELSQVTTFTSRGAWLSSVGRIATHVDVLAQRVPGLELTMGRGPRARDLDYDNSACIAEYARGPSRLSHSLDLVLDRVWPEPDVLLLTATSPEDLLCALVLARSARRRRPGVHISLIDHGYENFSLGPHLERLRPAGAFLDFFDTIVESKDERDAVVVCLLARLAHGRTARGWLTRSVFGDEAAVADRLLARLRDAPLAASGNGTPPPLPGLLSPGLPAAFTPEPILWTRASPKRCYWGRCAFCVQNVKLDDPRTPSTLEAELAARRLAAHSDAGMTRLYISDEALSPHFLRVFCEAILRLGVRARWACRCKLERAYTRDLLRLMREAGCYEILFGIESISDRLLRLMDKYVEGLDADRTAELLHAVNEAGLGMHINLIAGFPGATLEETQRDVEWTVQTASGMRSVTYTYNRFTLFAGSPMLASPARFGIESVENPGDLPTSHRFRLRPDLVAEALAVQEAIPALAAKLDADLGWSRLGDSPGARLARDLYHGSGHGCVMKSSAANPFDNPLHIAGSELDGHRATLDALAAAGSAKPR